ncbi:MAG: alpha/beta hydrolase [Treponemataceae bacterium]|nr:MAG: alpha/beta hydrolase [Treponemataceae bacterium]
MINTGTQFIEMTDGAKIALHSWIPDGGVRAVILICHGMIEYAKRYDYAARKFAEAGYAVLAHDQRGHGETAGSLDAAGYICNGDGFSRVVIDVREIAVRAKTMFPQKRIILLGHSFGSFVTQGFIEQFGNEIDAVMLSGTAGPRRAFAAAGLACVKLVGAFKGKKYRSKFLNNLTFGGYNAHIPDAESPFDWLSRDEAVVKKRNADPWNSFVPTVAFFRDLTSGLCRIHEKSAMAAIPKELPALLFSGGDDPVGGYGKTVAALAECYRANGMRDLTLKLYPGGRHEMLRETNKDEVIADIIAWLSDRA